MFGNKGALPDPAVQDSVASEFLRERKRLREARSRWIEENECPVAYGVTGIDGSVFSTPFQIGKIRDDRREYPYDKPEEAVRTHADPALEKQLLEGVEAVLDGASTPGITISQAGGESHVFLSDEPIHPPIMEGEDYGQYYARVSRGYERAEGARGSGRPVAGDDPLRQPASVDPAGDGRSALPGGAAGGDDRPALGGDADAMRLGDEEFRAADDNLTTATAAGADDAS